ncbi:MAG TPA: hypothetical protein VMT95_07995 [Candidatus Binatia bacterium]|nr:hypothetical protein [Candidatus Binatia bacterium]
MTLHAPAISPDGKTAALVISRVVWDDDRRADEPPITERPTTATPISSTDRRSSAATRRNGAPHRRFGTPAT